MTPFHISVVDDDPTVRRLLQALLEREGYAFQGFESAEELTRALPRSLPDLFILDVDLPGISGLTLLERLRARHPRTPVLMLTSDTSAQTAVSAMKAGAWDYVNKPIEPARVVGSVRNALESVRLARRVRTLERGAGAEGSGGMVGRSPAMRRLFAQVDRVAASEVNVLIRGESGTGKELVARAIHELSGRSDGPFEAVNCAALPEGLLESELFGHEKGAFTGATRTRRGIFERAHGGTLLLDELGDMSPGLQGRLLRAVQEREVVRVGGASPVPTDFRLVSATHRDLEARVASGEFREDLFFRVAVFEIHVPPLRDRKEDIPRLVHHFLDALSPGEVPPGIRLEALEALESYDWPGNVRELENALARAVITCDGEVGLRDMPGRVRATAGRRSTDRRPGPPGPAGQGEGRPGGHPGPGSTTDPPPSRFDLESLEEWAIRRALRHTAGNLTEAARLLGMGRTTLYRRLDRYGIPREG